MVLLTTIPAQTRISPVALLDQQRWSVSWASMKMLSNLARGVDTYPCGPIHGDACTGAWLLHPSCGLWDQGLRHRPSPVASHSLLFLNRLEVIDQG